MIGIWIFWISLFIFVRNHSSESIFPVHLQSNGVAEEIIRWVQNWKSVIGGAVICIIQIHNRILCEVEIVFNLCERFQENGSQFENQNDDFTDTSSTDNEYSKWVDNQGDEVKNVFGFNSSAELVNGRAAMIGFLMLILTELVFSGRPVTSSIFGIN